MATVVVGIDSEVLIEFDTVDSRKEIIVLIMDFKSECCFQT